MQPTHTNVLALKNSGLGTFLYADVGTELNGSALTILSMIARLGGDPWEQAARWAKLPKAAVIDGLAQGIAQMPLAPSALAETHATAARLVLLLPSQAGGMSQGEAKSTGQLATARQVHVLLITLCCAFAAGMALNLSLTPKLPGSAAAPTQQASAAQAPGHEGRAEGGGGASTRLDAAEASAKRDPSEARASSGTVPAPR